MPRKKTKILSLLLAAIIFFPFHGAKAVIPPDFIFNVGTQVVQVFSITILFFTAAVSAFFQFFKNRFYAIPHKKIILPLLIIIVIGSSLLVAFFYAQYRQNTEYQKWLEESKMNSLPQPTTLDSDNDGLTDEEEITLKTNPDNPDTDGDSYNDGEEIANGYNPNGPGKLGEELARSDANDQLNIGNQANTDINTSSSKFVSNVISTNISAKFIENYYSSIANGRLDEAYALSKKTVSLATFKGWYVKTTKITLDKLVRIDDQKSSIELTLYEGDSFTRYGVLMTLELKTAIPTKVATSEVKILAQGQIENNQVQLDETKLTDEYEFFGSNAQRSVIITNQDFKNVTNNTAKNYIVLDARENIEYTNGHFPDSLHIRFADLKAGRWLELPKDKFIYVICWSGIRGKEVAEFLRTKKIVASYLENGANGWVDFGGKWIGNIKFGEQYSDSRYQVVFSTSETKRKVDEGVLLVDTREPYKYRQFHISGSVNIPTMYTPSIEMEAAFDQVPKGSKIITVCDDYVNCFDAKITGVELELRGHEFLGRYNKPWEYVK